MRRILLAALGLWLTSAGAHAQPLKPEECRALRDAVEAHMNLAPGFAMTEDAAVDLRPRAESRGCKLVFRSSGVLFEVGARRGFAPAERAFRDALAAAGYRQGPKSTELAADGPAATRFGVEKPGSLCAATVALSARKPEHAKLDLDALMKLSFADRLYRLEVACVRLAE